MIKYAFKYITIQCVKLKHVNFHRLANYCVQEQNNLLVKVGVY